MPSRCCSPSDSMRFQCASSSMRWASSGKPTAAISSATLGGIEAAGLRRIGDRGGQRRDREVRPLRQDHQPGIFRHGDGAGAERPDAGERAEQRGLAGAGRAADQHPLAQLDRDVAGIDQRHAVRQPHRQILERNGGRSRRPRRRSPAASPPRRGRSPPTDRSRTGARSPRAIPPDCGRGSTNTESALLHPAECIGRLHQSAELDDAGEIGRAHHDEGKHHGRLRDSWR